MSHRLNSFEGVIQGIGAIKRNTRSFDCSSFHGSCRAPGSRVSGLHVGLENATPISSAAGRATTNNGLGRR